MSEDSNGRELVETAVIEQAAGECDIRIEDIIGLSSLQDFAFETTAHLGQGAYVAQIKIYGLREYLTGIRTPLSDTIHACVVEALQLPPDKRFHRFFPLKPVDFVFPSDRSYRYTIIEISIFEGRSDETKRALLNLLMERITAEVGIPAQDIEITIFETPKQNWGIRGKVADELALEYRVEV